MTRRLLAVLFVVSTVLAVLAVVFQIHDCVSKGGAPVVGFFNTVCVDKAVVR